MRSLQGADLKIWAQAAQTWERSLQRIAPLEIDWILNGHEPARGLPLSRRWLDRRITTFGKMMNPWFFIHDGADEEDEVAGEELAETGPADSPASRMR